MVIAGPGTGKTQIIALRTANILRQVDARPDDILITTFTDAGVTSIKKRLIHFLGTDAYRVRVSTFHAFADDIIASHPEIFSDFRASRPIDAIDQIELIEHLVTERRHTWLTTANDPLFYVKDIVGAIAKIKQEDLSPERFLGLVKDEVRRSENPEKKPTKAEAVAQEKRLGKLVELAGLYAGYETEKRKSELYDYHDMIAFALSGLREHADLRYEYAERYQFVMLDESQDTNTSQMALIDEILSETEDPNLCIVGDDDQSIYRFQGANVENLLSFSDRYPARQVCVLSENFRSRPDILAVASRLIAHNTERIVRILPEVTKELHAHSGDDTPCVSLLVPRTDLEERGIILEKIRAYIATGIPPEEIAIIVRGNREMREFTELLEGQGIPVESAAQSNILESPYVLLLISIVRIVDHPTGASKDILRLLYSDILAGVDTADVLRINEYLHDARNRRPLYHVLGDITATIPDLRAPEAFARFREMVEQLQEYLHTRDLVNFLHIAIDTLGLYPHIRRVGSLTDFEDVYSFLSLVRGWVSRGNLDASVPFDTPSFFAKIERYQTYGQSVGRENLTNTSHGVHVLP